MKSERSEKGNSGKGKNQMDCAEIQMSQKAAIDPNKADHRWHRIKNEHQYQYA
jgi:hypothetical protein